MINFIPRNQHGNSQGAPNFKELVQVDRWLGACRLTTPSVISWRCSWRMSEERFKYKSHIELCAESNPGLRGESPRQAATPTARPRRWMAWWLYRNVRLHREQHREGKQSMSLKTLKTHRRWSIFHPPVSRERSTPCTWSAPWWFPIAVTRVVTTTPSSSTPSLCLVILYFIKSRPNTTLVIKVLTLQHTLDETKPVYLARIVMKVLVWLR